MKQELAQDIALMRYSMISPLIVGLPDEYKSKEAYFRAASARGALHPNGSFIHPAPTSIKRWYQHYQKSGFYGLLAARIGSTVHYDQPYTPTQKARVERWFRTMKDQWMAGLDMRDFHTLEELRGSLYTYVNQYNQKIHSSLNGKSPQERYFSEPDCFHRLPEDKIDQLFLLELERRVSIDCVVTIDHIEYEVDYRFAKQRIKLRYSPDMEFIYVVEADGTLTPIENADIKREKPRLYGGDD